MSLISALLRRLVIQRKDHFQWSGVELVGLTAVGQATIDALKLNLAR
jgi:hypothetical protein